MKQTLKAMAAILGIIAATITAGAILIFIISALLLFPY